jgi:hypothetical protein
MWENDFKEAYDVGQADGKGGKKRLALHGFKQLFRPGTWLPGAESRLKQAFSGYEAGFQDAIRVVNVQPAASSTPSSSTPTTASTMTNTYAYQNELQNNLKGWLHRLTEHLDSVAKQYVQKVEQLHAEGMMDETYQDYVRDYLDPTRERITRLIQHIEAQDIPRIEQEMRFLEDAAAGGRR